MTALSNTSVILNGFGSQANSVSTTSILVYAVVSHVVPEYFYSTSRGFFAFEFLGLSGQFFGAVGTGAALLLISNA